MKVLFDYQIFIQQRFGGVSRYHIELAKELGKIKNCKVDIPVIGNINHYLAETGEYPELSYSNTWVRRSEVFKNRIFTILKILGGSYDIVHPTWYAPYINRVSKGKLVVTIHDMVQELYAKEQVKNILSKKLAIYQSDAIIAISKNTKKDILKIYPDVNPDKIRVIYHGTNHLPNPCKPNSSEVPKKYLLFVGKRSGYKNVKVVFDAFSEVIKSNSYNDLRLVLVGGGKLDKNEYSYLKFLHIEKHVIQMDVSDAELAYLYDSAIAFIYPSKYEGFGFPILEAFDNCCPVISSNTSSLPEVGGNAALYFDPNCMDQLKEQIFKLLNNVQLRTELIQQGTERVKFFTWERTALETYELYNDLLRANKH